MPSNYLPEIFDPELMSEKEAMEVVGLVFRHWNTISGTLANDEVYTPISTSSPTENARP